MADEQPPRLIICESFWQDDVLKANITYLEPPDKEYLRVRFYEEEQPDGFESVATGTAYVHNVDKSKVLSLSRNVRVPSLGNGKYRWSEGLPSGIEWQMLIFIFPDGFTLVDATPIPNGAKNQNGRLATYWLQKGKGVILRTEVTLVMTKLLNLPLSQFVQNINKNAANHGLDNLHVVDDPKIIQEKLNEHSQRIKILKESALLFGEHTNEEIAREIDTLEREKSELLEQYRVLRDNKTSYHTSGDMFVIGNIENSLGVAIGNNAKARVEQDR